MFGVASHILWNICGRAYIIDDCTDCDQRQFYQALTKFSEKDVSGTSPCIYNRTSLSISCQSENLAARLKETIAVYSQKAFSSADHEDDHKANSNKLSIPCHELRLKSARFVGYVAFIICPGGLDV